MNKHERQKGQALLTGILLATVMLTVGLSILELTRTETQTAQLEQDQKRAFAAAEGGLEAAIGLTPGAQVNISDLNLGTGLSGQATVDASTSTTFTTPSIPKDGSYTFYLTGYDSQTNQVIKSSFGDDISIDRTEPAGIYCGTPNQFAVELTFLNMGDGVVTRRLIDECDLIDDSIDEVAFGATISTVGFSSDPHVLLLRIISPSSAFTGAKLTLINESDNNWPLQGKTVTSTARTSTGVTKKVQLFQSYPQLPAEFFVTSF